MFRVACVVGIALAAGIAIGVRLRPAGSPSSLPIADAPVTAAGPVLDVGEAELSSLRARAADLRSQVASRSPKTAAVRAVDVASLRARRDELVAKKDGENLLALIRECLRAGPEGYALALEIAVLLGHDAEAFGLNREILERLENGGLQPAVTWALQHYEGLPKESLELAIWCVGVNPEDHGPDAILLLLTFADTCPDGGLACKAAARLRNVSPGLDPELDAFIRRHAADAGRLSAVLAALANHKYAGLDAIFSDLVAAQRDNEAMLLVLAPRMGDSGTPASLELLSSLARDPRPPVAEEARFQLVRARPPVPGALVERAGSRKAAAPAVLHRGDIVTACNGAALASLADLWKAGASGEAAIRVTVRRGDETIDLDVDVEELRASLTNWTRTKK